MGQDRLARRSIACVADLHDACTWRGLPCACPCHVLTAAARRASTGGLTYTADLAPDRTVTIRRVDAAGVVTDIRFDDPHEALGFLEAEGRLRASHAHTCPHGGAPIEYAHADPACAAPVERPHPWCHSR